MIFTEISASELIEFQKKTDIRYYYSQMGEYSQVATNNNLLNKILAVKKDDQILAFGIFSYYKHKKFFYGVYTQF